MSEATEKDQAPESRLEETVPGDAPEETTQPKDADKTDDAGAADDEAPARNARKVREGLVTSTGMDKTIIVTITDRVRHPKYNKFVLRTKKLFTHDESNDAGVGDRVRVMETRPMSKNKRWRLTEIVERAR